jgi:hypothetical protein
MHTHKCEGPEGLPTPGPVKLSAAKHQVSACTIRLYRAFCNLFSGAIHEMADVLPPLH